ncbi:polysaccharide lyase family protein [Micromonospora sp. 067-2]|uniref:polysaccharide lyase family protein n=1 Tax=Micromonospora sp. 067-2 TaxID=2789270 RepID=UPI003978A8C0
MATDPGQLSRRSALGVLAAAAGAACLPGSALAADPAVSLVDSGSTVTLSNGLLSVVVTKATARITSVRLIGSTRGNAGFNLVGGSSGGGYTTFDYHLGTTRSSKGLSGASYRIVQQTPDRVEIAMTTNNPATLPFAVDVHMAMERGMTGLYCYMVFGYPSNMPNGLAIQQLRYAFAAGDPSFTYFIVDDARGVQQRPSVQDSTRWVTLQDSTYELPNGEIWSKYQNSSDLEGDSAVFMISNGKLGLSMVQASKEYFAGGPTKQELTCHDYNNGEILLWHPFTSHYGTPDLEPAKGWQKAYGPFYLHVNEASGTDPRANVAAMWADAKVAASREQAKWPYRWVSDPLYAANARSTVTGKLAIAGGASPNGAWVVLSTTGADRQYQGVTLSGDDWQYRTLDYVYSARADSSGTFRVPGVRPGTYTVTAFVDGVLGEYKKRNVTIPSGPQVTIGNLTWTPVSSGQTLWQIGSPNRSAEEFHIPGGPDGFRSQLAWLEYPYEFPNGVDFRVGVDDPAVKWNYFQPCYRTPGTPLQLQRRGTTPDYSLTTWRIRFDSNGYTAGTATLDIALAGSVFGTLRIALNGTTLASFDPLPGNLGDASSYRLACRGIYRQLAPVVFPATSIRPGENIITLTPVRAPLAPRTRANTVDNWMEPIGGVMYDVIRLQVRP